MCLCLHQLAKRGHGSGSGFKYEKLCSWFNLFLLEDIVYNTIVCWSVNTVIISYRCLFVLYIWAFPYLSQLASEQRPNCLINKAAHSDSYLRLSLALTSCGYSSYDGCKGGSEKMRCKEWLDTGYKDDDWWQRQDFYPGDRCSCPIWNQKSDVSSFNLQWSNAAYVL